MLLDLSFLPLAAWLLARPLIAVFGGNRVEPEIAATAEALGTVNLLSGGSQFVSVVSGQPGEGDLSDRQRGLRERLNDLQSGDLPGDGTEQGEAGRQALDDAALRAIDRTGSLPRDVDGRVPSPMIVEMRPLD